MNIALVHDWLTNMAGAERVLLQLLSIYPEADVYTSIYDPQKCPAFEKHHVQTTYLQNHAIFRKYREALVPYTPLAFESLDLSNYDMVISNTTFAAKGVITKPETIHICYCHTPTRYLWEPELDDRASRGMFSSFRKKVAHNLRIWDRVAAERPDYYLGNSETVKKRIKKYYKRDAVVVYPPVDIDRFQYDPETVIDDYFLFVSRLIGYKRADLVVEAFNELNLPLKIIGSGPEETKLRKIAGNNIEFLGKLSDEDLTKYYAGAKAFIFPAEEDFGIVPVEAMACGRPVIAYGRGGAAETVIDGKTGLHFKPQTVDALVAAVKKFNPNDYDGAEIRRQAEKFSNHRFEIKFSETVDNMIEKFKNMQ